MKIQDYLQIVRKGWWLLIIAAIIAGTGGYFWADSQPALYEASVLLSIGSYIESPNPNTSEIQTGEQLARTYLVLARTRDVLQSTIDTGDFSLSVGQLGNMIDTQIIPGTSLIRLTIEATDPALAADVANELARQVVLHSPSNLTQEQEQELETARTEILRLQGLLSDMTARLDEINAEMEAAATSDTLDLDRLEQLRASRDLLIDQINATSANIAEFSTASANLRARTNSVDIVEEAVPPTTAQKSDPVVTALIAALLGAGAAAAVLILREAVDDTIRTPEEALGTLGLPVMGKIARFGGRRDDYAARLIAAKDPSSRIAEEFRAIRTRLIYDMNQRESIAYVITSPGPEEGKSVVTANLAVALATANYRVLLVDADMRRPSLHEFFGLSNDHGLSNMLSVEPADVLTDQYTLTLNEDYVDCIKQTDIPNLRVVTSGPALDNPAEQVGSAMMHHWYKAFEYADNVDVILFDTPPALSAVDTAVLAATTDATVLLVLRSRRTRRGAALETMEMFRQLGREVCGVVLNNVKAADLATTAAYYYKYKGSYSASDGDHAMLHEPVTLLRADRSALVLAASNGNGAGHSTRKKTARLPRPAQSAIRTKDITRDSLVLFTSDEEPLSIRVEEKVTLGRRTSSTTDAPHIDLDDYGAFGAGVSRVHAAVYRKKGKFYIEDMNSSNGTWLNNQRLEPGRVYHLPSDSEILLGEFPLRVFYLTDEAATEDVPSASEEEDSE